MPDQTQQFSFKVLTSIFTKALPRLTDASFCRNFRRRAYRQRRYCLPAGSDGRAEVHPLHVENWPDTSHYEFLATLCGAILPTVAMPYTRKGIRQRRTVALSH